MDATVRYDTWDEVLKFADLTDARILVADVPQDAGWPRIAKLCGIPDQVAVVTSMDIPGGCMVWARHGKHWNCNADERYALWLSMNGVAWDDVTPG